jgi:hypothetical protein
MCPYLLINLVYLVIIICLRIKELINAEQVDIGDDMPGGLEACAVPFYFSM